MSTEACNSDVEAIQEWLRKQTHFPPNIERNLIERFLVCCEGSLEKTKSTMQLFFCLRADAPEFFTNRDPLDPTIQEIFRTVDLVPLPNLTKEGYKCFLYRLRDADPSKFHFNDYVKAFFLVGDTRILTETKFPTGEIIIFDMAGFTLRHLAKVVLPSLRKYMVYSQEAHPVRLRAVHVVNVSPLLDRVMAIAKPLIKPQVSEMIHFHSSQNTGNIFNFISPEVMPNEYGGTAGPVLDIKEQWRSRVENNREWFLKDPWLADNKKRKPDCRNATITAMEGSFRNLIID